MKLPKYLQGRKPTRVRTNLGLDLHPTAQAQEIDKILAQQRKTQLVPVVENPEQLHVEHPTQQSHVHKWGLLRDTEDGQRLLVCRKSGCWAYMLVDKPCP